MSLGATLGIVVAALRTAGVPFMIAGSIASTLHGEPRATQDVDIVVDPLTPEALDRFATSLEPARFYVGDHRAAFSVRGMFNVIDKTNGWKIDLILRRDRPFSVAEFERRQPATIEGVDVDIATAEDVVLSKLEWARHGESERQRSDARAVLAASSDSVDRSYLELWAEQLEITAISTGFSTAADEHAGRLQAFRRTDEAIEPPRAHVTLLEPHAFGRTRVESAR